MAFSLICVGTAQAQFKSSPTVEAAPVPVVGGFKGPSNAVTTVSEALNAKDETSVVLTGTIEKQTAHEKYLFKDTTGSVIIEIDDEDWRGVEVTPNDTIIIRGETDKDLVGDAEIDVDSITKK